MYRVGARAVRHEIETDDAARGCLRNRKAVAARNRIERLSESGGFRSIVEGDVNIVADESPLARAAGQNFRTDGDFRLALGDFLRGGNDFAGYGAQFGLAEGLFAATNEEGNKERANGEEKAQTRGADGGTTIPRIQLQMGFLLRDRRPARSRHNLRSFSRRTRALQIFNGFFHRRIVWRNDAVRRRLILISACDGIVRRLQLDLRRHAFGRNLFSAGSVIGGDRENQRRAVIELNQLLHRSGAVGAAANRVAAMIIGNRAGKHFGGAIGAVADQDGHRLRPNNLRGIGSGNDRRNRLALQSGDGAGGKKELRGGDAFLNVAESAIAQIENQFVRALLIELRELFANLFR